MGTASVLMGKQKLPSQAQGCWVKRLVLGSGTQGTGGTAYQEGVKVPL